MTNKIYVLYSDESHITDSRYGSITTISLSINNEDELSSIIREKLIESEVHEFKWKYVHGAKYRLACIKLIELIIEWTRKELRVDTIIWDNQDSRHAISGRDDMANMGRMYYHLLRNVMDRRKPGMTYVIKPDEQVEIDWKKLRECLEFAGNWQKVFISELLGIFEVQTNFSISELVQVKSSDQPICQVCDLFAGLAAYSYLSYDKIGQYEREVSGQLALFDESKEVAISRSEREKIFCISYFLHKCKVNGLGICFSKKKKLWTANPSNPINFWHYQPQNLNDRAPLHR